MEKKLKEFSKQDLKEWEELYAMGPSLREMPRRTLEEKGIAGPTLAHVIEEIHTPANLAFVTFTTGTTAFQNPTGITCEELPAREDAARAALSAAGIQRGSRLLVTYPLLVNLFTKKVLEEWEITVRFLARSNRDSFLAELCGGEADAVLGESSFLRSSLEMAGILGLRRQIPEGLIFMAAGSPLDGELEEKIGKLEGASLHDFYGCQEFGWLAVDGVPLRPDVQLVPVEPRRAAVVVGGLVVGDCLEMTKKGHRLNEKGTLITYSAKRLREPWETVILETTAADRETVERAARSILRLKARIVMVSEHLKTGCESQRLGIRPCARREEVVELPREKTGMFCDLLQAQIDYQSYRKTDPVWKKREELC